MQILHPFSGSIQQYAQGGLESDRYRPESCPLCQAKHELAPHGFYSRTIVDIDYESVIRIRRFLCRLCRRTVSLLPEGVLPYLRFSVTVIGLFLKARLEEGRTLQASAEQAQQPEMPYQRGQHWVRRFQRQAESLSAALAGLVAPRAASNFTAKAVGMLARAGWIRAQRFLFGQLRVHLLGWPPSLAPAGLGAGLEAAVRHPRAPPHTICMDGETHPA